MVQNPAREIGQRERGRAMEDAMFCVPKRKKKAGGGASSSGGLRRRMAMDEEEEAGNEEGNVMRKTEVRERERERERDVAQVMEERQRATTIYRSRNDATREIEIDTAFDRDARALKEERLRLAQERLQQRRTEDSAGPPLCPPAVPPPPSSSAPQQQQFGGGAAGRTGGGRPTREVYRGANAYTDYKAGLRREQVIGSKFGSAHGPARASSNVRVSYRIDYQPDVCKDYKETGYCGYGDSCKFLHDRSDYKSGWQLEREWDEKQKQKQRATEEAGLNANAGADDGSTGMGTRTKPAAGGDELPWACFICRKPFTDPVVTKCKHYFCEHCALKHNAKSKNCFICNRPTAGIFNVARDIIARQQAQKKALPVV